MKNDHEGETSRFPELFRGEFDEIQLREIPPTPIQSTFDIEREPRTRSNSAISKVSEVSAVSSGNFMNVSSPPRGISKTRGRSCSTESRYSVFPPETPRRKSTASTKTTRTSRTRASSLAASEWSTTLDVPVPSESREPRASRVLRSSSSSSLPSSPPSRSIGYSNADSDTIVCLEAPARANTISSRQRGFSNSDSMISARTSISQDWGDHRSLLTAQPPPPSVSQSDLMAQFENFVE